MKNLLWAVSKTHDIVQEEIMQHVRTDRIFGLLHDVAVFIRWKKLRTDWGYR